MKKLLALALALSLLAGCAGTPVIYYSDCTCPTGPTTPAPTDPINPPAEGAVKTGLAIVANASKSADASCAEYDVTLVAVTVDDKGVIEQCIIDSIGTKVEFDNAGVITKVPESIATKNELGDSYGMVNFGGAKHEWNVQAANFAAYVTGKTAAEVSGIAVDAGTKPTDADLSAGVTIAIGGFQALIAKAMK